MGAAAYMRATRVLCRVGVLLRLWAPQSEVCRDRAPEEGSNACVVGETHAGPRLAQIGVFCPGYKDRP